jgi:iron(II)-dependent oxidoreductase
MAVSEVAVPHLARELESARAESDRLFRIIKADSIHERPIDARHRVIFYLGHLDGFDAIQICREGLGIKSSDPELDDLFQAGIDPDSNHLPADVPSDWPSLTQVSSYVARSRKAVDDHLGLVAEDVALMALEHRLMHLETLAYMFHNLPYGMKHRPRDVRHLSAAATTSPFENGWRTIPRGAAVLGKAAGDEEFGWDNEFEQVKSVVPAFRIERYPVTNREFLRFVEDGGPEPHFWRRRGNSLVYRGMFEEVPLPLDWPAYVTQAQAQSYAEWRGKALPSEEQFHRAAYGVPSGENRKYPWGEAQPDAAHGNFNFRHWDPQSVRSSPAGDSAFGVSQLVGNGWEWTNSPFHPFPGFRPRSTYPGYSANFFDGEHFVLKGGSSRTAARLLRGSFRNWFRRDYPYVYAKFRCVEN